MDRRWSDYSPGRANWHGGVVGAGSVVTHDVPPWTVWAGNPARQIGIRKIMGNRETGNR